MCGYRGAETPLCVFVPLHTVKSLLYIGGVHLLQGFEQIRREAINRYVQTLASLVTPNFTCYFCVSVLYHTLDVSHIRIFRPH